MPANQISVFLDPTQLPARTQDQATFESLMALFFTNLPNFGAQVNALAANLNMIGLGGGYSYTFDSTTTDADPGNGKVRLSSATQNTSTTVRIDTLGNDGKDWSAVVDNLQPVTSATKGYVTLIKSSDPTQRLVFAVTGGISNPGGYRNIIGTVIASSSANPFANGDALQVFFARGGDKGDVGPTQVYPMLHVRDEKASGTGPGNGVNGGTVTRTLNTVKKNTISGASLAGNQITLPAGTYRLRGVAPAMTDRHQAQLYNITAAAVLLVGTSEFASSTGGYASTHSWVQGEIVLAATTVLELRHYTMSAASMGLPAISGQVEVYSEIIFEKVT